MSSEILTYKDIINLYDQNKKQTVTSIVGLFKNKWVLFRQCNLNDKQIYNKISGIFMRSKVEKRNSSKDPSKLEAWLSQSFVLPQQVTNADRRFSSCETEKERQLSRALSEAEADKKDLKRHCLELEQSYEDIQLEVVRVSARYDAELKFVTKELANFKQYSIDAESPLEHLANKTQKLDKIQNELNQAYKKLKKCDVRNLNKKIKRRDKKIEALEVQARKNKEFSERLREVEERYSKLKDSVERLRKEKKCLQSKLWYQNKLKPQELENEIVQNKNMIAALQLKIKELQMKNADLEQTMSILDCEVVKTFEDGKYLNVIREVIIDLLGMNISIRKVDSVIRIVLQKLANLEVDHLPSQTLKSRLFWEARHLAQMQVAEALLSSNKPENNIGSCLHSDATSKFSKHYQSYQCTDILGDTYSMGLLDMATGTSDGYIEALNDNIRELVSAIKSVKDESDQKLIAQMTVGLKNTMSDQGPTNAPFNEKLKLLREELLPVAVENWGELDNETRKNMSEMGFFYCKMHLLANMASEVQNGLKLFEDATMETVVNPHGFQLGESAVTRLIRTSCKAFHPRGSDECGVAAPFKAYIEPLHGENGLKLESFLGNRFHILFTNAAATYFYYKDFENFLMFWPNSNKLLRAVKWDLAQTPLKAGVRALGIIHKLIVEPLDTLMKREGTILDCNADIVRLHGELELLCLDSSSLMHEQPVFPNVDLVKGPMYKLLFQSVNPDFDALTQHCLELISHSMLILLERQGKDHLKGGKYDNPSEFLKKQTANVPKTNVVSERDFAILDYLIHQKPAASTSTYETLVMWANNKTARWLDNLDEEKKQLYMNEARKSVNEAMKRFCERQKKIKKERQELLKAKQLEVKKKEEKQVQTKVHLTKELTQIGGLWTDPTNQVAGFPIGKQYSAIMCQLQFHKDILKSKGPTEFFQKSSKGHKYNIDEKLAHLVHIVETNNIADTNFQKDETLALDKGRTDLGEISMRIRTEKEKLTAKLHQQRTAEKVKKSREMLQTFIEDPNLLVGQLVIRKMKFNEEIQWFPGKVIHITVKNGYKSKYIVQYDGDENKEEEFDCPLLVDMKNGALIVKK